MQHLILNFDGTILQIGDNYSTEQFEQDSTKMVHIVNGIRYIDDFTHIEVASVPSEIEIDIYKYIDGEFVKNVDLLQEKFNEGYDQAILDIMGE